MEDNEPKYFALSYYVPYVVMKNGVSYVTADNARQAEELLEAEYEGRALVSSIQEVSINEVKEDSFDFYIGNEKMKFGLEDLE